MASYTIDTSHSDVGFSVRHMVFAKVRGHFDKWSAKLAFDAESPGESSVSVRQDRRGQHRHPRREARRAPQAPLPGRREVPEAHLQEQVGRTVR